MFVSFGIKDAVDILFVAILLYYTYRFMRESRTLNVFIGILSFIIVWLLVSQVLEMRLTGAIFDKFVGVGTLAIIVLFQEEIRKFLYSIGEQRKMHSFIRLFIKKEKEEEQIIDREAIMPIVMACINMARRKCGALIVIERTTPLNDIVDTGDTVNANINQRLIENIFFKNSPLHDGAMIISQKRIKAAGCILPVSHDLDIPRELGLRHRAAMGISQQSDALAIVVSEETGRISAAMRGQFRLRLSAENLEAILTEEL
ncbi:MAG: diadenylate cyclase CdaA [Prevotellaceae bacterium]|nr:diadenylate cyclase CdaA [Prevotellaceae bacterium]